MLKYTSCVNTLLFFTNKTVNYDNQINICEKLLIYTL